MWLQAPIDIQLLPDEVHIWRVNLDNFKSSLEDFTQILSEDELGRAKRFHFEEHQERFTTARGILRCILGRYLNIEPFNIRFGYSDRGKPFLVEVTPQQRDLSNCSRLNFNLSHSQNFALYAVSLKDSIGVDLECIKSNTDVLSLAQRFFSPSEFTVIKSAPQEQQQQLFFRYWTCKESYLKATGIGLADLQNIEISLTPSQPAQLNIPGEWSLVEIKPFSNYAAAICLRHDASRIAVNCLDLQFKYWDY
ncbi:MAG: 4'-phosphopantetheinyl transferase superfamily protein [Cyanobacteria bacterium P01_D01_bin.50]